MRYNTLHDKHQCNAYLAGPAVPYDKCRQCGIHRGEASFLSQRRFFWRPFSIRSSGSNYTGRLIPTHPSLPPFSMLLCIFRSHQVFQSTWFTVRWSCNVLPSFISSLLLSIYRLVFPVLSASVFTSSWMSVPRCVNMSVCVCVCVCVCVWVWVIVSVCEWLYVCMYACLYSVRLNSTNWTSLSLSLSFSVRRDSPLLLLGTCVQ